MAEKDGIFIHSTENLGEIIQACKDTMEKIKSGETITWSDEDETYKGLKLYMNEGIAQKILNKGDLQDKNGKSQSKIYPLKTHLIVCATNLKDKDKEQIIRDLQIIVKKALGVDAEVSNIPISEAHSDIPTSKWKVSLDVPEIKDLEIFKKVGLPDNFKVNIPGVGENLSVKFYCSKCKKGGHTRMECSGSVDCETIASTSGSFRKEIGNVQAVKQNDIRSYLSSSSNSHSTMNSPLTSENDNQAKTSKKDFSRIANAIRKIRSQSGNLQQASSSNINLDSTPSTSFAGSTGDTRTKVLVIPDRIKAIILECTDKTLSGEQLIKFLNRAWGKRDISKLPEEFHTTKIKLRNRLNEIKKKYERTKTEGQEEKVFRKWFGCLIKRLD